MRGKVVYVLEGDVDEVVAVCTCKVLPDRDVRADSSLSLRASTPVVLCRSRHVKGCQSGVAAGHQRRQPSLLNQPARSSTWPRALLLELTAVIRWLDLGMIRDRRGPASQSPGRPSARRSGFGPCLDRLTLQHSRTPLLRDARSTSERVHNLYFHAQLPISEPPLMPYSGRTRACASALCSALTARMRLLHKLLMRAQIAKSPLTGNSFTHNINGYGPVEGKIMPFICPQSQPTSNRDISREAKNHK